MFNSTKLHFPVSFKFRYEKYSCGGGWCGPSQLSPGLRSAICYVTSLRTISLDILEIINRNLTNNNQEEMPILLNEGKVTGSTRKFFTRSVTPSVMSTRSYISNTTVEPTSVSTLKSSMFPTSSTTTTTLTPRTTTTSSLAVPDVPVPSSHIFLILGLLILIVLLLVGFGVR